MPGFSVFSLEIDRNEIVIEDMNRSARVCQLIYFGVAIKHVCFVAQYSLVMCPTAGYLLAMSPVVEDQAATDTCQCV